MHYVCIEDNLITTILNYVPAAPESVRVVKISDEDNAKILAMTHCFDVKTNKIVPVSPAQSAAFNAASESDKYLAFLDKTDWKILRHMREIALGVSTSLSEDEYVALEKKRDKAAKMVSRK